MKFKTTRLLSQWFFKALNMKVIYVFTRSFQNSSVPVYFVWLKYISWFMYGYEALIINQWKHYGQIGK